MGVTIENSRVSDYFEHIIPFSLLKNQGGYYMPHNFSTLSKL